MQLFSARLLRMLNLILPVMQIVVTVIAFEIGTTFDRATNSSAGEPPIIPAGYAFIIWSVIYAGSVLYGILQITPERKGDPLLVRIRPLTASAFIATICWLAAARFNLTGLTVLCMVWLVASLLPAFMAFMRAQREFTSIEQIAMVIPLSIYTGWVTVAIFADLSAFLFRHGLLNVLVTPAWWAVIMVCVAGLIAARLTFKSASIPFALTICWALVAILVANLTREHHLEVVLSCAMMAVVQIGVLLLARLQHVTS